MMFVLIVDCFNLGLVCRVYFFFLDKTPDPISSAIAATARTAMMIPAIPPALRPVVEASV